MDPLLFEFKLADFDLKLLPVDAGLLKADESMLKSAVREHLRGVFKQLPGAVRLTPQDDRVSVMWVPQKYQDLESMMALVIDLLNQRAFAQAEPILRTLFFRYPDDPRVLFNLGMMLSDQGELKEACEVLSRLTRKDPDFADGWNALGVALSRVGKQEEAESALKKSLELDPENGYTLKNLGALFARTDTKKALPHLKRAAELLPSDQASQYWYAKALVEDGNLSDADPVLKNAIALNEHSEIAELCREASTRIAHLKMRAGDAGTLRMDVVMYCLEALEKFKELGPEKTQAIAFEIALLGRSGLNINNPDSRYQLKSLPGELSGLQLVAYMYTGFKAVAPQMDAGIDFSKEYELALQMFQGEKGRPGSRNPR